MRSRVTFGLDVRRSPARRATVAAMLAVIVALTGASPARAQPMVDVSAASAPPPGVVVVREPAPPFVGPRVITDYEEGEPVPAGYHVVKRTRKGLIIGGAVTFGVLYFLSVLVAAANSDAAKRDNRSSETDALFIPAIGPFVQMAKTSSSTANVFLALDGLAQAGGIAMFVAGISLPRTVLVRDAAWSPSLRLAPLALRGTTGLAVLGTF